LSHFQGQKLAKKGFAIQVASLNKRENLLRKETQLQSLFIKNILVNSEKGKDGNTNFKVFIGPFATALEATSYQKSLKKKNVSGFIVDLTTLK
jgi:cell division protein FtsN